MARCFLLDKGENYEYGERRFGVNGVIAQLGERLNGIQEVRSSILLSSTNLRKDRFKTCLFLLRKIEEDRAPFRSSVLLGQGCALRARPNFASVKPVVTLAHGAVAFRLLTTATDFGKNNSPDCFCSAIPP